VVGESAVQGRGERDAVLVPHPKLLGAADEVRGDELVRQLLQGGPHDGRVMLPVNERQGPHERDVTSSSIRPVYFSYANVSIENWMIRSCPWNGCFRQMSTWLPESSTTL
jgi:hypothetical protein